jgi:hypothetical protein
MVYKNDKFVQALLTLMLKNLHSYVSQYVWKANNDKKANGGFDGESIAEQDLPLFGLISEATKRDLQGFNYQRSELMNSREAQIDWLLRS